MGTGNVWAEFLSYYNTKKRGTRVPLKFSQPIYVGVVRGVATWYGRMMSHIMVVMFRVQKMANLSYGA